MKIVDHIPGQRIEVAGDYEHSRWGVGCMGGCGLGCLTPLLIAAAVYAADTYTVNPWLAGCWGVLTIATLLGLRLFMRTEENIARLVVDRERQELVWEEWAGRSSTREHRLPLGDIRGFEIDALSYDDHQLDANLKIYGDHIPEAAREKDFDSSASIRTLAWLLSLLPFMPNITKRSDDDSFGELEEEWLYEADTASLDMSLDWIQKRDLKWLGAQIAEIIGVYGYELDPHDDECHRFLKRGGTPLSDVEFLPPGDSEFHVSEATPAEDAVWDQLKSIDRSEDRIVMKGQGWLPAVGIVFIALALSVPLMAWDPSTPFTQGLRDLLLAILVSLTLSFSYKMLIEPQVRQVAIDRLEQQVLFKGYSRLETIPIADVERIVTMGSTVLLDARRGSFPLPIDGDSIKEDGVRGVAQGLAQMLDVASVSFKRAKEPKDDVDDAGNA